MSLPGSIADAHVVAHLRHAQSTAKRTWAVDVPPPQGIVLFRVLVRLKVFQLAGIAGISVVATTLLSGVGAFSHTVCQAQSLFQPFLRKLQVVARVMKLPLVQR